MHAHTIVHRAYALLTAAIAALVLTLSGSPVAVATGRVAPAVGTVATCAGAPAPTGVPWAPPAAPSLARMPAGTCPAGVPAVAVATPTATAAPSGAPERHGMPSAAVTRAAGGLDEGAPVFAAGTDDSLTETMPDEQARRDLVILTATAALGLCLALAARRMRAGRRD